MNKFTLTLLTACVAGASAFGQSNQAVNATRMQRYSSQNPSNANAAPVSVARTTQVLTAFPNMGWTSKAPITGATWATGPVFAKPCISSKDTGFIYNISGGDASFANTALNQVYNITLGTWKTKAPIPVTRTQLTPVHVKNKIYAIGGYGGSFSPVTNNNIYDIASDTWTTGAALPVAVGDYAVGTYKDSLIYIIGGYNGSGDVNNVQIYNPSANTWATGTAKTGTAVAGARAVITGSTIVFVGGYSQTAATELAATVIGSINPLAPATIAWSAGPNYPGGPSGRLASGMLTENDNRAYFAGGDPNGQGVSVMNQVYAYNVSTSAWETGPNMLSGASNISALAGVVEKDTLFLVTIGGYNGTAITNLHQWLKIGPMQAPPSVASAQTGTSICTGGSVALNAYNGTSYAWTPGSSLSSTNTSSTIASPTVTTTYTVSIGRTIGCPLMAPITVTVNTLPPVSAMSNSTAICNGQSALLTASGANTYSWSTTANTATTSVSPANTASYTVTGTDLNGCSNTASVSVTVNTLPTVSAMSNSTAVCNGQSALLTASGANTYSWSTTANTATTSVSPANTASYTVTGTDLNGCSNTASVSVTVNMLPTVSAMSNSTAVCNGQSALLTASGANTYSWSTTANTATTSVSPANTASYTVTGTDLNGCSNTASVSVTVNPLPPVSAMSNSTAVCNGQSALLTASGANTYSWSTTANTATTSVSPANTASYTVTGTDLNGCSNTASVSVTVNPLPPVMAMSSPATICNGQSAVLSASGANIYSWSTPTTTVSPGSDATYTVTGQDMNGCFNTAMVTVTVNANPTVMAASSSTMLCSGQSAVLTASGANSYTWSTSAATATISVSPANTSTYTVTGQDINGCSNTATVVQNVSVCTGISNAGITGASVSVYPNPSTGLFHVSISAVSERMLIEVYSVTGQVIAQIPVTENTHTVDLSAFSSGIYYVRLSEDGKALYSAKVIRN